MRQQEIVESLYRGLEISELARSASLPKREIYRIREMEIRRLFSEGCSKYEVGERLGVRPEYALGVLKKGPREEYYNAVGERYKSGLTQEEVGEEFGISQGHVSQILGGLGIEARPKGRRGPRPGRRKADYEVMGKRYQEGLTQEEVGEEFGISRQRVSQILKELGIEARGRGKLNVPPELEGPGNTGKHQNS